MSGPETRENFDQTDSASRKRAIVILLITIMLAALAWILLGRATDAGLDRLAAIDRVRASCDSLWARAVSHDDTGRVAATPLRDTIDAQSDNALRTCGDLGKPRP